LCAELRLNTITANMGLVEGINDTVDALMLNSRDTLLPIPVVTAR
jgi:hypothetical protein